MPLNNLFPIGSYSEQSLTENLIIESIRQHGREFYYIPRTLVAPDAIFGEDSLSKFKNSYMIEAYIDNVEEWGGSGGFISKFGYTIEDQGQLTIARRRWEQLVGRYGQSVIPDRPAEGDLLYFPMAKSLFEIKYVEHQNPFYQLGKLYVFKLKVELFQYSSERIETDIDEINKIALDMTFDVLNDPTQEVVPNMRDFYSNSELRTESLDVLDFSEDNPFGDSSTSPYSAPFALDHIIISYTHDSAENLNSHTRIMSSYFDGLFVGNGYSSNIMNIMKWGGNGTSAEYVYIDVSLLKETFPELPQIDIDFRADWVSTSTTLSIPVVLSVVGYSGGTMTQTGTTYSISNSTATKNLITTTQLVTANSMLDSSIGSRIAVGLIDTVNGSGNIIS